MDIQTYYMVVEVELRLCELITTEVDLLKFLGTNMCFPKDLILLI